MKKKRIYLTPGERAGFLTLTLLILLSHSGILIYEKVFGYTQQEKHLIIRHLLSQDSINQVKNAFKNESPPIALEVLKSFNPNSIEIHLLPYYGFSSKASSNLEKYRASGGTFYLKEDLLKIYQMDTNQFYKIYSLINLPSKKPSFKTNVSATLKSGDLTRSNAGLMIPAPIPDQPFDPNNADRQILKSYGLSDFAINNLNKYKAQGGRLSKDSDLLKIYGVDTQLFNRISPLIAIPVNEEHQTPKELSIKSDFTDSINTVQPSQINLNTATAAELRSIKGIGPYISKAIIEYRNNLGGYHSIEQLREIFALRESTYEQIKHHLLIKSPVRKIYAPDYTFKELIRHPYIDYQTTQTLKNIPLTEYDEQIKILIKEGMIEQRLQPYLQLEDPHKLN